jgi:predicted MFS family arabinose efflux permease
VLFVNVPIGVALMVGGYFYIQSSERLSGRFDVLGGALSVAGMVSLVYGFIHAAKEGWSDSVTVGALAAGVVLLAGFVLYESRSPIAMMPMRIFANRSRSGAYLVMLVLGAAMFGMFYFLTFFVQGVLGYSALKTGFAFLPFCAVIIIGSGIISQVMPRTGPKPLIAIGVALCTVALFLFSTVKYDTGYWSHLFPTMVLMAVGMSFVFVPLTTVAVSKVVPTDAGLASALLNVGQQVGGAIGLSVLATTAATAARNAATSEAPKLTGVSQLHFQQLAASSASGKPPSPAALTDSAAVHAFNVVQAHSSSVGFLTAAIFGVVAVVVAVWVINVKKTEVPHDMSQMVAA